MTQGFTKGVPIDTDPTMALNSNQVVPSQAAVVAYIGTKTCQTVTADSGGSLLPSVGNFNFLGGAGVTTSGAGSTVTISLSGGGFTWNDVSGAFSPVKNNGYFITGTATGNLPATPLQGDTIKFFVDHPSQVLTIDAPGTQIIRMGSAVTAAGGTAVSTAQGDSVELTYRASDTCWCAIAGFSGIWILT